MPAPRTPADALFARGHEFDFFQAVRLVEAAAADLPPVGDPVDRLADAVRVRALPSLTFPAGSVARVGRPPGSAAADVVVTFFGLFGPSGTLPTGYTEAVLRAAADTGVPTPSRAALRDWLDLVHHRLGLLLYAGWEKYRFPLAFVRQARLREAGADPPPDRFTRAVLSLVGLGAPSARGRVRVDGPAPAGGGRPAPLARVDDLALLRYAGLLARRQPTAVGLEIVLADYFGVGVRVEELTGQWLSLGPGAGTRLGPGSGGLGRDTVAGDRVWDPGSRFRVLVGPLRYAEFVEFLPDRAPVPARKAFFLLSQVVRLYAGPEFDFEVRLGLLGAEVPDCVLREVGPDDLGIRLGWNTWLPRAAPAGVVDDVGLDGDPRP